MSNNDDEEPTMKMRREVPIREPKDKPWMAMLLTFFAFGAAIGGVVVRAWDESEIDRAQVKVDRAENAAYAQQKTCGGLFDTTSLTTQPWHQGQLVMNNLAVDRPLKIEGSDLAGRITFKKPWKSLPSCVLNASLTELDYVCAGERSEEAPATHAAGANPIINGPTISSTGNVEIFGDLITSDLSQDVIFHTHEGEVYAHKRDRRVEVPKSWSCVKAK